MEIKQTVTEEVKAVGTEAKLEGGKAMVWIEAHPAILGGVFIGLVIGFAIGYLVGSFWKG